MNYEHPNKIEAPCQKNELFGRTEFSLHGVGQMGRLIVYLSVTLRWVTVTVLTDSLCLGSDLRVPTRVTVSIREWP